MPSEERLLDWLRSRAPEPSGELKLSIGDDCAVLHCQSPLTISTDVLVEGVHFWKDRITPPLLARKSLRVNLSDLAAMGSLPVGCLLTLSLPPQLTGEFFESFMGAFFEETEYFDCPLMGGDLSRSSLLQVGVTVLGSTRGYQPITRQGARAGDLILISGIPGRSRQGLDLLKTAGPSPDLESLLKTSPAIRAHLLPDPQLALGEWLAREELVHAMIDVSDGLALDLLRMARASGVRAQLDGERLLALGAQSAASGEKLLLDIMLSGGEDYILLFAASEEQVGRMRSSNKSYLAGCCVIGEFSEGSPSLWLNDTNGVREIQSGGYDHFQ